MMTKLRKMMTKLTINKDKALEKMTKLRTNDDKALKNDDKALEKY